MNVKTLIMNKQVLLALGMIVFIGAVVAAGTGAFFSDTETSTGNTFTAGAIDLKIDNESYVTDVNGVLVRSPETSWQLSDLTDQLFFNFNDLKPGDVGEDTISVHVDNNDAWACMAANITATPENGQTEPESNEDATVGANDGELQNELNFAFWADDGDNVYEDDETIFKEGSAGSILNGTPWTLADSVSNVWTTGTSTPLPGASTRYVAKAWCYGELGENAVSQDNATTSGPLDRGTGFTCNGANVTNASQTDGITADVSFFAVQSRNNGSFQCSEWTPPTGDGAHPIVKVGSADYVPGTPTCDITVDDDGADDRDTIQEGVDLAPINGTVCVAPGNYNEFTVSQALTVRGLNDPEGGSAAIVKPSGSSVTALALINASNVTITGLQFDGSGVTLTGQSSGVQISPVVSNLSNVNITYNVIKNIAVGTGSSAKGIQWWTAGGSGLTLSNSNFKHNTISNISSNNKGGYGIQTVGAMSNVAIENNTISNTTGNWGAGIAVDTKDTTLTAMSGNTIALNQIMTGVSDGASRFAVQVENGVDATGVGVHQNNIETLLYGGGNAQLGAQGTLNAENNWWGTATPTLGGDVFVNPGTNVVDFNPSAGSAFVQS